MTLGHYLDGNTMDQPRHLLARPGVVQNGSQRPPGDHRSDPRVTTPSENSGFSVRWGRSELPQRYCHQNLNLADGSGFLNEVRTLVRNGVGE